jgi:molybdate transport system substrate-binding protein
MRAMPKRPLSRCRLPCAALLALWFALPTSLAAELKLLSAGAVEPGLRAAVARYESQSGDKVTITFATAPVLRERAGSAAAAQTAGFDLLVAPVAVFDAIAAAGTVRAERATLGSVGIGVAVRPDAPRPDLASADSLKAALRNAESVVYNRASTGQYVANLLAKLGIADAMAGKTTQVADGAAVVKHLMQGRGREFGFAPITEILLHKDQGLVFVGALPAEVQNRTTYQASVAAQPRDEPAATRLWRFLSSTEAIALFRSAGID